MTDTDNVAGFDFYPGTARIVGVDELTETELVAQARAIDAEGFDARATDIFGSAQPILAACETFYMHGSADEETGEADGFGHYYRVARWIVATDSAGFHYVDEYGTELAARDAFAAIDAQYSELLDQEEN